MKYRFDDVFLKWFCTFALSLHLLPAAAPAAARGSELQILGSEERYWLARFEVVSDKTANQSKHTGIYVRAIGDKVFSPFVESDGLLVAMAQRGTQLAVVEQQGDWTMVSEAGTFSQGPDLPDDFKIIDLAGGDDTFWALGEPGLAATSPASSPDAILPAGSAGTSTSATTLSASTRAADIPPSLFRLDQGVWTLLAPLPPQSTTGDVPPSLSIIGQTPYLAFAAGSHAVRVVRFNGKLWEDAAILDGSQPVTGITLLRGTAAPVVWIARDKTIHSLDFLNNSGPSNHVPVRFIPATARQAAIGYALGRIRVVYDVGGVLTEQSLDPFTGAISGVSSAISYHTDSPVPNFDRGVQYVIWGALFLSIFGAMYWRRQMQGMVFDLDKLRLAPLGRRAAAGTIDLFPLIIGMAVLEHFSSPAEWELVTAISMGLYILLTALTEMISGRSLGKWLMGLEVVSLTGDRPPRWSLLVRNLLRVIDVGLFFVPLAVVMLSPLRQRTGDVAAGTLVVQSVDPPG